MYIYKIKYIYIFKYIYITVVVPHLDTHPHTVLDVLLVAFVRCAIFQFIIYIYIFSMSVYT